MKIGVFDSGLGGLTVVRSMRSLLSDIEIIYLADTLHAPYGEKRTDQILQYSLDITRYFIETYQIDALVIACNTATSVAIGELRNMFPDLVIVGTEPGIKPAMQVTQSGKVGILATPATLKGDKYQELADSLYGGSELTLFEQACPGLVEQIEAGEIDSPQTQLMLESWLYPMREAGVDTIVLGCTHYPLAGEAIKRVMGYDVALIETGEAIGRRLQSLLQLPSSAAGFTRLSLYATGEINGAFAAEIIGSQQCRIERIVL
jgi:glutamate racemase